MTQHSSFPTVTAKAPDGSETTVHLGEQRLVDEFYSAAGFAINEWAHIDGILFSCFHWVLGAEEQKAATVYFSLSSSNSRLQLTNELMEGIADGSVKTEWAEIYREIRELTPVRNILAHQPINCVSVVTNQAGPGQPIQFHVENWLEVSVHPKELLRGKRSPRKITIEELVEYCKKVHGLRGAIAQFKDSLQHRNAAAQP